MHSSVFAEDADVGELDIVGRVARVSVAVGNNVSVGRGVCVGVSEGGMAVSVGMDACVCATAVFAAEAAVPCTCSMLSVGVAGAPPQATIAIPANRVSVKKSICFIFLTIWVTATFGNNAIIPDDDFPAALRKPKTAGNFKVLCAIYIGQRRVLPNWSSRQAG